MDSISYVSMMDTDRVHLRTYLIWSNRSMRAARKMAQPDYSCTFCLFSGIPGKGARIRTSNNADVCAAHLKCMGIYSSLRPNRYSLGSLSFSSSYLIQPAHPKLPTPVRRGMTRVSLNLLSCPCSRTDRGSLSSKPEVALANFHR